MSMISQPGVASAIESSKLQAEAARPAYRWTVLSTAFALQAMYTLLQQGLPILAPFFHSAFKLSLGELGLLVSSLNAGLMVSALPSGAIVDRIGERRAALGGSIVACALVLGTLAVQHVVFAVGGLLFLAGLLSGTVSISSGKAVYAWFDQRERGFAMGLRQIAVPVGAAIASVLMPLLGGAFGWQLPLALAGTLQLALCFVFLLSLRVPLPSQSERLGEGAPRPAIGPALLGILRDRSLVLTASVSMIMVLTQYIVLAYLILYLGSEGFPALVGSTGLLLIQIGAVAGRVGWGRVSDGPFQGARKPVVGGLIVLSSILIASLAAIRPGWPLWAVYAQMFMVGGAALGWNGLMVTLMAELGGPDRAGAAIGFNSAAVFLGALIGPPAFGAIVDLTHSYHVALLALACSALVAFIPYGFVPEATRRQHALITP